jgi:hypothetical protein
VLSVGGDFTDKLLGTDKPGSWNPKFRKRKRWQGATWTPENQMADKVDGHWCRACKSRHGYMTMDASYEKASDGNWRINWSCRKTGNVIGETVLGAKGIDEIQEALDAGN